jgi:type IV secretory pathway VirB2 component (pilin)
MIWSDIGRGIATIAVMVVGVGAVLGKVSWGQALIVAIGISLTFGAPIIVPQLIYGNNMASKLLTGIIASCV